MQTVGTRNINGAIYEVKKESKIDSDVFYLFCNGIDESYSAVCNSYFSSKYPHHYASIHEKCIEFLFEIASEIEEYLSRSDN